MVEGIFWPLEAKQSDVRVEVSYWLTRIDRHTPVRQDLVECYSRDKKRAAGAGDPWQWQHRHSTALHAGRHTGSWYHGSWMHDPPPAPARQNGKICWLWLLLPETGRADRSAGQSASELSEGKTRVRAFDKQGSHQENNPIPSRISTTPGTVVDHHTPPLLLHCLLIWFEFVDVFGYRIAKLIWIFWHFCSIRLMNRGAILICSTAWLTWLLLIDRQLIVG